MSLTGLSQPPQKSTQRSLANHRAPFSKTKKMAVLSDFRVRICSQEIIKHDLQLKALIQDINDCLGPQHVLDELNFQVKVKFRQLRRRIQGLEQLAKEQDSEKDKNIILCEADGHRKQILSNQAAWRKANLTCKLLIDSMEKDELLNRGIGTVRPRKTTKESLAEMSSDITESLMIINRLMSEQVKQSEGTVSHLVISSRTVLETNEEFRALNGAIHLGRKLILKYNRREVTDKLLIFLALALFLATVVYIVKKRLFPFL
ncbi:vesicle transport protein SEC20 [Alosa pseudoharengus]|uniref:vesicle transport protein SEC20 n=1 Tax=Alosa pseudoharengus TaxID=34774 RepID=UPI003F893B92